MVGRKTRSPPICEPASQAFQEIAPSRIVRNVARKIGLMREYDSANIPVWARDHSLLHEMPDLVAGASTSALALRTITSFPQRVAEIASVIGDVDFVLWGLTNVSTPPKIKRTGWATLMRQLSVARRLAYNFREVQGTAFQRVIHHGHLPSRILERAALETGFRAGLMMLNIPEQGQVKATLERMTEERNKRPGQGGGPMTMENIGFYPVVKLLEDGEIMLKNDASTSRMVYGRLCASTHGGPTRFQPIVHDMHTPMLTSMDTLDPGKGRMCRDTPRDLGLIHEISDLVLSTWVRALHTRNQQLRIVRERSHKTGNGGGFVTPEFLNLLRGGGLSRTIHAVNLFEPV